MTTSKTCAQCAKPIEGLDYYLAGIDLRRWPADVPGSIYVHDGNSECKRQWIAEHPSGLVTVKEQRR